MIVANVILATTLVGQHYRESKHDPFTQIIDRRSPALVAKLKKQRAARHHAAEQSRNQFAEAIRILNSPPSPLLNCPCTQPGRNAFH